MNSTELLKEIKNQLELLKHKGYDKNSFKSGYLLGYAKALQFQQTGVSGSNFYLEEILSKIKEVGLTNNDTSKFGDGYEKAINDILFKFQNKCKKCGKNIEQQFRYCSIECKEYYYS